MKFYSHFIMFFLFVFLVFFLLKMCFLVKIARNRVLNSLVKTKINLLMPHDWFLLNHTSWFHYHSKQPFLVLFLLLPFFSPPSSFISPLFLLPFHPPPLLALSWRPVVKCKHDWSAAAGGVQLLSARPPPLLLQSRPSPLISKPRRRERVAQS